MVAGCIDILNGGSIDEHLLDVLAGPAAGSVLAGAEGGLTGYWPRVWALRGLLYAWSDDAVSAVMRAFGDQSWRVREMAVRVVAKHIVGEAFDDVVKLQDDPTPRVRTAASLVAIAGGEIVGHVWHHSESSTDLPYPASPRWQSDPTGRAGALALLS